MRKALYIIAALGLAFASADATSRKSGDKIQIVIRGTENGPWKAYLFGATCHGKLEVNQPADSQEPVEIVCR